MSLKARLLSSSCDPPVLDRVIVLAAEVEPTVEGAKLRELALRDARGSAGSGLGASVPQPATATKREKSRKGNAAIDVLFLLRNTDDSLAENTVLFLGFPLFYRPRQ